MTSYIIRRLLIFIPTLFGVITAVFLILHATPGNPAKRVLGKYATQEAVQELEKQFGLDKPLYLQYTDFISSYVQGDFGKSFRTKRPVINQVLNELKFTLHLAIAGMLISTIMGVGVGIISAIKPNSWIDNIARVVSLLGVSMPVFWSGMILIIIFALNLNWFPIIGTGDPGKPLDLIHHLILPALTVGALTSAVTMRMTRSSMLDTLNEDYIRTAFSKGLSPLYVYTKHALRNAALPVVTIIGLNFGTLLGGAVLTETVFSRHGLGKLIVDAVKWKDYPTAQAGIFLFAVMFMVVNLLTDLSYGFLDPKIRYD